MTFESFYSFYPRSINKTQALKAYNKAIKNGATNAELINGAIEYAQWCERNNTAREFICHPATFLNQQRWLNNYKGDDNTAPSESNQRQPSKTSLQLSAAFAVIQKKQTAVEPENRDLALPF